jgi:hypothetical protein
MRWVFLFFVITWLFAVILLPLVAFYFTDNLMSFSLFGAAAPPLYILYRMTCYLFPKDDRDYQLAAARIQLMTEITAMKLRRTTEDKPSKKREF